MCRSCSRTIHNTLVWIISCKKHACTCASSTRLCGKLCDSIPEIHRNIRQIWHTTTDISCSHYLNLEQTTLDTHQSLQSMQYNAFFYGWNQQVASYKIPIIPNLEERLLKYNRKQDLNYKSWNWSSVPRFYIRKATFLPALWINSTLAEARERREPQNLPVCREQ